MSLGGPDASRARSKLRDEVRLRRSKFPSDRHRGSAVSHPAEDFNLFIQIALAKGCGRRAARHRPGRTRRIEMMHGGELALHVGADHHFAFSIPSKIRTRAFADIREQLALFHIVVRFVNEGNPARGGYLSP